MNQFLNEARKDGERLKPTGDFSVSRSHSISIHDSRFFGSEYDVQQEKASLEVHAGISGLRLMLNFAHLGPNLPINVSILTSTLDHRGVHMSRLVAAAQAASKSAETIEDYLRSVCKEIDLTQPGCVVQCDLEIPYGDQFPKIKVSTTRGQPYLYSFSLCGVTSCPCSKRMSGVGHMQRATLTLELNSFAPLSSSFLSILSKAMGCFSSVPVAYLKRPDEAKAVIDSQENSKFVEDIARDCLRNFPNAQLIEVRSQESIHMHDAIARWSKRTIVPDGEQMN